MSLGYLLVEFGIGMRINGIAPGGLLPLILLPIAAQAVALLPRIWAALMCMLVIAGVSGNLTWVPDWPTWFRNIASATAAVVFVVVYVGVAAREREARQRVERLSAEVAQLAAANERNRLAREIHDTLGHYLTVIHVQLEAARALVRRGSGPRAARDQPRADAGQGRPHRRPPVGQGAARGQPGRRHRRAARLARGRVARRDASRATFATAGTAAAGQRRRRARAAPHRARSAHQRRAVTPPPRT